jgi:hypothetical protein
MSYKPDYGLRLMNSGIGRDVDQFFYDFRLYSLTVLGRGQYSTMVHLPWEGEICALSLDFNNRQLGEILAKASPELSAFIRNEISRDPSTPRTIVSKARLPSRCERALDPYNLFNGRASCRSSRSRSWNKN